MSGEALTYVEIDIPYCSLSYGVAPCQASFTASPPTGDAKCFNTFPSCQDTANFSATTKTLRFAIPTAHLPRDIDIIGAWVTSVDYSPSIVSLGENLGQRASVKITFTEHRHSDAGDGLDKYQQERISGAALASGEGYDPYTQGTFWARLRARHQSLRGRALRLITGFVGDALADMETRTFYIESFDGPNADGKFSITAKDALKFLDGDRAQAPVLSSGFLVSEIDEDDTEATLSPSGVGDDEYPLSGYVNIGGNEVAYFTRDPYTKVLLHFDGADGATTTEDTDNAGPHAVTFTGSAQIDAAQSKFGGSSLLLGAAGNYAQLADHDDWFLGTGNFTIDMHVRFTTAPSGAPNATFDNVLMWQELDINNRMILWIDGTRLEFLHRDSSVTRAQYQATHGFSNATWHHLRVVRSGSSFFMFKDGVALTLTTVTAISTNSLGNVAAPLRLGGIAIAGPDWIDEFRWRKGIADTTSNFTAPTAAYGLIATGDIIRLDRAQLGSVASSHDAQDRVQLCLRYVAANPDEIIAELIDDYTDTPAGYIDAAAWRTEVDNNLDRVYTATITEPTPVNKLVSELIEQGPFALWDDNAANKLRLQVLRGIPTSAALFDHSNVLKNSFASVEQPDKRISRVQVYYGQIDPTKPLDNSDNYRSVAEVIDAEAETIYGPVAFNVIRSRWVPAGGRTHAERVANIKLGRFRAAPRKFSFAVFRSESVPSAVIPELGNGYQLQWRTLQNPDGTQETVPVQVVRLLPSSAMLSAEAEEMRFTVLDAADLANRIIIIDFNENNLNWKTLHDALYPEIESGQTCTLIVAAGVIIGSTSISSPGLDAGTWPAGVTLVLQVIGRIQGKGGDGTTKFAVAQAGGPALYTREAINLDVDLGEIWGGGGGGGGVGGGGAGQLPGTGSVVQGSSGQDGTTEAGGAGASNGGAGGGPGLSGTTFGASPGGAAGAAIDGVSFVTVTEGPGDIRGGQIN